MDLSLDEMISAHEEDRAAPPNRRMRVSTSSGRRGRVQSANPYGESRPGSRPSSKKDPEGGAAIKFLLSRSFTGCLIGTGGSAVRELAEFSGANVLVSDSQVTYPGTSDRIVFITGTHSQVNYAQCLIWEMIGYQTDVENHGIRGKWSPSSVHPPNSGKAGEHDDVEVEAKLSVPSQMGGHIVGRAGSSLKEIARLSDAKIDIDQKDDADLLGTGERVITLSGTAAACMKCTAVILDRMVRVPVGCLYHYGTNYTTKGRSSLPPPSKPTAGRIVRTDNCESVDRRHYRQPAPPQDAHAETLSASTTIEIAVPDSLIKSLLGSHGSTLNEITQLSGASILVSKRGEFVEGTTNRLVTIVGSPANAQTAHTLVLNKLKQAGTD